MHASHIRLDEAKKDKLFYIIEKPFPRLHNKSMKDIIPKDSRYIPFVQQRSCCVPTCIAMVMYKQHIPLVPQEVLGYHLGLTVPKENKHLYWNARSGKRPASGYGTQIYKKEYSPNKVFKKLKIPLNLTIYPISQFADSKKFIKFVHDKVQNNRDLLVCFDHGELSKDHIQGGHVCIIDRIFPKRGIIRLIDPSATQPKWREVKIADLKHAMESHGDNKPAGFWELTRI